MAKRPVFYAVPNPPYYRETEMEFTWNAGLSKAQKQRNIAALHQEFSDCYPERRVLEISSKSMQEGGVELSAFNLKKFVPSLGRSVPVECAYQAGKVFEHGGPYLDLLDASPKDAKRDERLNTSGKLLYFQFEDQRFDCYPITGYYDWLYLSALEENPDLAKIVLSYDAFTDIEFNPAKSNACQARSAAKFRGMKGK